MAYHTFNLDTELKKAAQGKKTKVPPLHLVSAALEDYPAIHKQFCKAAGITVYPPIR